MSTAVTKAGGSSELSGTASILSYDETEACAAGAERLYQGYQVIANGIIAANTPFSWGTAGATWSPVEFGALWAGVYSGAAGYSFNGIVSADTTSTAMYKSIVAGTGTNTGNALNNATKWVAASFNVVPASSIPILAYQVGETYYVGQHICYNGIIVTPNGTVIAGTPFAWGSTGATFKPDLDSTNAGDVYSLTEVNTGKKWIDGSYIYRKVIANTDAAGVGLVATINLGFTVTGYFAIVGGYVPLGSGHYMILPGGSGDTAGGVSLSSFLNSAKTQLIMDGSANTDINPGGYVVVEYTR
jgi:hypothetical protein